MLREPLEIRLDNTSSSDSSGVSSSYLLLRDALLSSPLLFLFSPVLNLSLSLILLLDLLVPAPALSSNSWSLAGLTRFLCGLLD